MATKKEFDGFYLECKYFSIFESFPPEDFKCFFSAIFKAFKSIAKNETPLKEDSPELNLSSEISRAFYSLIVGDIQKRYDLFVESQENLSRGQILGHLPDFLRKPEIKQLIQQYAESKDDFKLAVKSVKNTFDTEKGRKLSPESILEILKKAISDGRGIVEAYGEWEIENTTPQF